MKGKKNIEVKTSAKKPGKGSRRGSVRKSVKKGKVVVEVPVLDTGSLKPLVFETPNKGFRPYEAAASDFGSPLESLEGSNSKLKIVEKLSSPSKRFKAHEQPDIWIAGIENVTFCSVEFDFPSFPIQY